MPDAATNEEDGRMQDETELFHADADEETGRRALAQLRESQIRYRTLAEAAQAVIFIIGRDDTVEYVNSFAASFLGLAPELIQGRPRSEFFRGPPGEEQRALLRKVFETGLPLDAETETPFPSGARWLGTTLSPMRDEHGHVRSVLGIARDITAQKRAVAALRESEERLRLALQATNDVMWDWDILQDTERWNEAGSVFLRPSENVEHRQAMQWWIECIHPDDRARVTAGLQAVLEDPAKTHWQDEYRHRRGDGSHGPVLDRGFVMRDERGRAVRMIGSMLDLKERRQNEEALRESERRLRTLADNLPHAVLYQIVGDRKGNRRFTYISDAVSRVNEVSADSVLADANVLFSQMLPDYVPGLLAAEEQALRNGRTFHYEFQGRLPGGRLRWFELTSTIRMLPDGRGVSEGVQVDITERKQMEEALRQLNEQLERRVGERTAALAEAEARYRGLAENTMDILYAADTQGRITYVGPQVGRYGWKPEGLIGRSMVEFVVDEDRDRIAATIGNPASVGELEPTQFRIRAADGRVCWLEETGRVCRDAAGRVTGFTGVLRDISERKEAEAREQETLDRLRLLETSVNQSPAVIFRWRIAPGWPVEMVTENVRQFGYEPDDFISGRVSWPGMTHPDDRPRLEKEVAGFMGAGIREFGQHYRLFTRSGEVRWVEDRNTVITGPAGEPTHVQGVVLDVTGRVKAEEALRTSEARFQRMAAYIDDVLYVVNGESGEFEYVSPAFVRMLGYTLGDVARAGGRDRFLAGVVLDGQFEDQQRLFHSLRRHETVATTPWQAWWRCKDGSRKFIEDHWIPVFAGERLKATYGMLRDITERRRAEESLRQSEEQFRAMFETAAIGMGQADPQTGRLLRVNQRMGAITGYSMDELLRLSVSDLTHPDDRLRDWDLFQRVIRGELPDYHCEKRYVRKDGTPAWVNVNMTVIRDAAGRPMRTMATIEDITGRKRAEVAEAEAHQRYRFLYDNMLEAYAHCRMIFENGEPVDYEILAVNPAYEKLTGLKCTEGRRVSEIIPDYRRDNPDSLETFGRVARTGEPARWEHYLAALDRWFSFSIYSPAPGEFVAVFDNVTQRKRSEQRIGQLNRIQSILAGVNHAIAFIPERQKLLEEICRVAVEKGAFKLAWVGMVDPDGSVHPVAAAGLVEYLDGIRVVVDANEPAGRGPVGTAIREGVHGVVEDVGLDPRMAPWRERAMQFGLRYIAAFPILVDGRTVGALATYAPTAGFYDETELVLLKQISDDISYALTALAHEEERRKAEERLRLGDAALAAAAQGIAIVEISGGIVWVNQAFTKMTGYALDEVRGQNLRILKSAMQDPAFYDEMWKAILAGRVWQGELVNRRKDGSLYNEDMTITPVVDAQGRITHFIAIKQDVTGRKRLEREMMTAVEREQERIGQDLHDGICQLLTGAKFKIALLGQKLQGGAPMADTDDAQTIETLLDQAIEQARGIAYGLDPVKNDPAGLQEALAQLAASVDTEAGPRCACHIPSPVHIADRSVSMHLYRIAQEAVQNAIKHGRARNVYIGLARHAGSIRLTVTDDGTGLENPPHAHAGHGLFNMRARAAMIGGRLEINSARNRGTSVVCLVQRPQDATLHGI